MRIEKLVLKNYRQFKDEIICFPKSAESDLHIIVGENGTGKTNLLNAINWCLYGDEPHLSKNSQTLPEMNLRTVNDFIDSQKDVVVEIHAETNVDSYIMFRRQGTYRIYENQKPSLQKVSFEVNISDAQGNTKLIKDAEEANNFVDRFVPRKIREFFFFDGERLDNYFRSENINIRNAVFKISQLDLLEGEIERKLNIYISELEQEAGRLNPNIELIRQENEEAKEVLESFKNDIEQKEKQSVIAQKEIEKLSEKLRGIPNIEDLEIERQNLLTGRKEKIKRLKEKKDTKNKLLIERGQAVLLYPVLKSTLDIIDVKLENEELPPPVNRSLIEKIFRNKHCEICGRDLEEKSLENIQNLLGRIGLSSDVANTLTRIESPLRNISGNIIDLKNDVWKITKDISEYEEDVKKIDERLAEIGREISGYNEEKIKEWYVVVP